VIDEATGAGSGGTPRGQDGRRLLLVHAHPDDETITTGATMALYAAAGAAVTLVTCTRGEHGEIIPEELAALAADRDDTLGAHRAGELAAAMAALDVRDHRFLGEGRRVYRDSGMAYAPDGRVVPVPDPRPEAFALAPVGEPAADLAEVVRELRPHVVITYEPGGGYGHPDHVRAHEVTMLAVEQAERSGAGGEGWQVPKVYWIVLPESIARDALGTDRAANPFLPVDPSVPVPSMVVPDREVTTRIDGSPRLAAKTAALGAHATQVQVRDGYFALTNGIGQPLFGVEYFRLVRGRPAGPFDSSGYETDLFAGIA